MGNDFSVALKWLRDEKVVYRAAWDNRFVFLSPSFDPKGWDIFREIDTEKMMGIWAPSHADILATDWRCTEMSAREIITN